MGWNGADLVTDFSAELGDTSTTFQTKVLRWINEGIKEIGTSHQWDFLRVKGKQVFASGENTHSLVMSQPSAPSVSVTNGGSLTDATAYKVLVTFYQSVADVESIAGVQSATATTATPNLTISLTSIPVSTNPLVTARKIYLKKGSGDFLLYSTISDNVTTTLSITADTSEVITPPDESHLAFLDGDIFIEEDRILQGYSLQQLLLETSAVASSGTPQSWAPVSQEKVYVYPKPSSNTTVSFYYFKVPAKVFNSTSSSPQIPSWLYEVLHDYVIWRGYQYRDRAGQESKKINYDQGLRLVISRKGKSVKRSGRVRSTIPDSDGFSV